jgi:signal transduction histidine kinase
VSSTPGLPESALIVPLVFGEHTLGVIAVHRYQPDAFHTDDLLVLEAIAAQAATAIAGLRRSEHLFTQLQKRISELQAVLGTMADAVLIVNAEGRLVALNRAARELLCVDDTSIVLGQPLEQQAWGQWPLGTREIADALQPMLASLQRGEAPPETEVRLERNGRRILSFSGTPLQDAHDRITGSVLIVRDVTGPHQVEELKDEMLSVASHDLKTPVTVIRSQAQLLRRAIRAGSATLEQVDQGLDSIVEQTGRLAKLLSLLLDLSRIEAGRFEIQRRQVDLAALASTVVAEVQATTDRHRLRLHVSGQPSGLWDDSRLEQVLTNLLTNAVKYSPDGGPIDVAIRTGAREVRLCVRDQGVGLAPEEAAHVFDRYFRAQSTRRLEGAGLGLYICQSILAAHGGRIWVESAGTGRGSSFYFVLPRGEEALVPGDITAVSERQ